MIKLTIVQNAMHSLYHALEHLATAQREQDLHDDREFDHKDHSVVQRRPDGVLTIYSGHYFTKPPATYDYKFAILHLIQGLELLIKGFLHKQDPALIFEGRAQHRTISLRQALPILAEREPNLLTPEQVALILQATDVRNAIEHFEFAYAVEHARAIATDFLAVCNYLAFKLFGISLFDDFSYDAWRDDFDPTGDVLADVLGSVGTVGAYTNEEMAAAWRDMHPSQRAFICFQCGARSASVERGTCFVCGAPTDEETGTLVDELEQLLELRERLEKLRGRFGKAT